MPPKDENPPPGTASGSKKIRMTLACERCRSKKVKCDFVHPICTRCQQTNASCSYEGSDTQVDLFNLMKMNETVEMLQQKVQTLEADMGSSGRKEKEQQTELQAFLAAANAKWTLSLTPRGLRIDTNIISLHDLYELLLSGMSQLDIDPQHHAQHAHSHHHAHQHIASSSSSSSTSSSLNAASSTSPASHHDDDPVSPVQRTAITKKKPLWKTGLKVFPLYSSWASNSSSSPQNLGSNAYSQSQDAIAVGVVPKATLDQLMDIYTECFLCLPSPEMSGSIVDRYHKGELDDMLANIVFAWTARHGAIYHDLFVGQDPNAVGRPFFNTAKLLLKERFMQTNIDTMHTCLMMYIYAIGDPSSSESEAYMYLGLANRMCLDLKMHCEATTNDLIAWERHRRYFHTLNFLETLCTVHSDRPFSLPSPDTVSVHYPTVLPHETNEARWRVEFMIQRYRITGIYRNIICVTAKELPLLSEISSLDKQLKDWYDQLPPYLRYKAGDLHKREWHSASFREQACIKLNCEYHFQMCQLYGIFFSRSQEDGNNAAAAAAADASPQEEQHENTNKSSLSAIDVLAKERCVQSANTIVELLACWRQLDQRWCHFSLETFMFSVVIYGTLLLDASQAEKDTARTHLVQLARLLATSPVKHHKHVVELVQRIQQMILEHFGEHIDLSGEDPMRHSTKRRENAIDPPIVVDPPPSRSAPSTNVDASTAKDTPRGSGAPKKKKKQAPSAANPQIPQNTRLSPSSTAATTTTTSSASVSPPAALSHQPHHPVIAVMPDTSLQPPPQQQQPQSMPIVSAHMIHQSMPPTQTSTGMMFMPQNPSHMDLGADDLPFSDFLYTPTLTGFQHQHQQQQSQSSTTNARSEAMDCDPVSTAMSQQAMPINYASFGFAPPQHQQQHPLYRQQMQHHAQHARAQMPPHANLIPPPSMSSPTSPTHTFGHPAYLYQQQQQQQQQHHTQGQKPPQDHTNYNAFY
ncbi:hypothetical protein BC940DRAFT_367014 [Gongronella butleri]|nr:hypothetical protein BC940DRAFT_367014 [Gongronella butleri]